MTVPAAHFIDDLKRREYAVALARYAVNGHHGRGVGDPIHEEVTEGRRKQYEDAMRAGAEWAKKMVPYQSCGDLIAWLLYRLGCRNERLVNRTADEGAVAWAPVKNVTNITGASGYRKAKGGAVPQPGDALFLLQHGGHLAVLLEWDEARRVAVSADYGQPYGRLRERAIGPVHGGWTLGGVALDGWLDLDSVEWSASPDLTGTGL